MIQYDTTDDDTSDWPDVPQQPLPARTPSVRGVDANDPVPATLTAPSDARAHAQTLDGEGSDERTAKVDRVSRHDGGLDAARRPCVSHGHHHT